MTWTKSKETTPKFSNKNKKLYPNIWRIETNAKFYSPNTKLRPKRKTWVKNLKIKRTNSQSKKTTLNHSQLRHLFCWVTEHRSSPKFQLNCTLRTYWKPTISTIRTLPCPIFKTGLLTSFSTSTHATFIISYCSWIKKLKFGEGKF